MDKRDIKLTCTFRKKAGNCFKVTLPTSFVRSLGFDENELLATLTLTEDSIIIKRHAK